MKKLFVFVILLFVLLVPKASAALAPDCIRVYGGGTKDNCVKMASAIPVPQYGNNQGGSTTKGGLPVYPAPSMNQTPATGTEMFSLLGLLPAAGAGLFLRRKSK